MKSNIAYPFVALTIIGAAYACGAQQSADDAANGAGASANQAGNGASGQIGGSSLLPSGGRTGGDSGAGNSAAGSVVGNTVATNCKSFGLACQSGFDCCSGLCDSASGACVSQLNRCQADGLACSAPTDCCTLSCVGGICAAAQCVSDGGACTTDAQCCGQTCNGNVCAPLNLACATAGNACTANTECCSKLCKDGSCAVGSSYCIQNGDICARAGDCCSGVCTVTPGSTVGTCGAPVQVPSNCDGVEGTVCGDCGGCCSRLCAPFGPTGVKICQPASGCRVVGELCIEDKDCCGGDPTSDLPGAGNGSCDRSDGGIVGRCRNVQSCSPQGNVCHFKEYVCSISSAPNKCCGGVGNSGVCQLDTLGVPRCNGLGETCRLGGEQCASADDCCDHVPCVRDPQGILRCTTAGACVPRAGSCTINADCCPGSVCVRALGSTTGTCGTPVTEGTGGASGAGGSSGVAGSPGTIVGAGGSTGSTSPATGGAPICAEYGQMCSVSSDCCGGTPCTAGYCVVGLI